MNNINLVKLKIKCNTILQIYILCKCHKIAKVSRPIIWFSPHLPHFNFENCEMNSMKCNSLKSFPTTPTRTHNQISIQFLVKKIFFVFFH